MGAWGTGVLDNDSAADFAAAFQSRGAVTLTEAFQAALCDDYLDLTGAATAIAAAAIVAAQMGKAPAELKLDKNKKLAAAIEKYRGAQIAKPELVARAKTALERAIGDQSELSDLWAEADPKDAEQWRKNVDDLKTALAATREPD